MPTIHKTNRTNMKLGWDVHLAATAWSGAHNKCNRRNERCKDILHRCTCSHGPGRPPAGSCCGQPPATSPPHTLRIAGMRLHAVRWAAHRGLRREGSLRPRNDSGATHRRQGVQRVGQGVAAAGRQRRQLSIAVLGIADLQGGLLALHSRVLHPDTKGEYRGKGGLI